MTTLAAPTLPTEERRPLSSHGKPKSLTTTPPRSKQHVDALGFSRDMFAVELGSPASSGPLSPPMSARSLGTVIDSEPSTPAHSPRMDHEWDGSTLVLLRPLSSSSAPSSPVEPTWEKMSPKRTPQKSSIRALAKMKASEVRVDQESVGINLAPAPLGRTKLAARDNFQPAPRLADRSEIKPQPRPQPRPDMVANIFDERHKKPEFPRDQVHQPTAPAAQLVEPNPSGFGKFTSKFKSLFGRKNTAGEAKEKKKKEKKKVDYYDVDRMEDVHWTEM